jgi:hypothetical protein
MTICAGIAEFKCDLIRGVLARDAERPRSQPSNWDGPQKLALDESELPQRLVSEGKAIREIALEADLVRRAIANLPLQLTCEHT